MKTPALHIKTPSVIKNWGKPLLHLLFPNICAVCGKSLFDFEPVICTPCKVHLPTTNYHRNPDNKVAAMFWGRLHLVHCSALLHYKKGNSVQKLIHQLKYKGREDIGSFLGTLCGKSLKSNPELSNLSGVIPVPLHPKKMRIRGYNQCTSIAKGIADVLNIPVLDKVVARNAFNTSQTKKDRYSRWENTHDQFTLLDPESIQHKHILIVDDVITTGSTLEALASSLNPENEAQLSVVTIGSTF